jgi:hypothetical protein
MTTALGALLGFLVSISSVGAGALGVTALLMLYPNMPTVRIVGSDIAHAVPLTLLGGLGHWWLGSVNWPLLASLLVGSIPGIVIGSHFASRVPECELTALDEPRAEEAVDPVILLKIARQGPQIACGGDPVGRCADLTGINRATGDGCS